MRTVYCVPLTMATAAEVSVATEWSFQLLMMSTPLT
jgi:hypothetical protein